MEKKRGRPPVLNPKSIRITFRIPEELEKDLKSFCEENKISYSEALRLGLEQLLKQSD